LVNNKLLRDALGQKPKTLKKLIMLLLEDAPGPKLYEEYLAAITASNAAVRSACEFREQQRKDAALRTAKNKSNRFLKDVLDFVKSKLHDPWKSVALNHTFNEITFVVKFDCPFVQKLLKPFMRTSSKIEEKKLMVAVQAINNEFAIVFDADVVGFEFLWSSEEDEASASMLVLQAKLLPLKRIRICFRCFRGLPTSFSKRLPKAGLSTPCCKLQKTFIAPRRWDQNYCWTGRWCDCTRGCYGGCGVELGLHQVFQEPPASAQFAAENL
jgi:hypothetical protein